MNMLVNYFSKAMAAATRLEQPQINVRTEVVPYFDPKTGEHHYKVQAVLNYKRLKSRGKGGKKPHFKTGIAAQRRAARKARNRKG